MNRSNKSLFPRSHEALHQSWLQLVTIGPVAFMKLSYYESPGSKKSDMDLLYSQILMYSLRQLSIPILGHSNSSKLCMISCLQAIPIVYIAVKESKGQPNVIICIILKEFKYPVTHTRFQGNRSVGSGEEDF